MREKLNKILAFLDTADGSLFSRFYNPDYAPTDEDVEEGKKRIDALIETNARFTEITARVNKEADWLAKRYAERLQACPYEVCKQSDCGKTAWECWREVARKAVAK